MSYRIRKALPGEETLIFSFLTLAARMSEAGEPIQKAISDPYLRKYWANWGKRPGDVGIVAESSHTNIPIACAWVRQFTKEESADCFFSDEIPELALAVVSDLRATGIGTATLRTLIEELRSKVPAICLSVRKDNPAIRLYERFSFEQVPGSERVNRIGTESQNMLLSFIDR
jgi:ribosomal protein S18 acetylase RimI-like enzyme